MRLAYLSADVLDRLLLWWEAPSASIMQMIRETYLPWAEQMGGCLSEPGESKDLGFRLLKAGESGFSSASNSC